MYPVKCSVIRFLWAAGLTNTEIQEQCSSYCNLQFANKTTFLKLPFGDLPINRGAIACCQMACCLVVVSCAANCEHLFFLRQIVLFTFPPSQVTCMFHHIPPSIVHESPYLFVSQPTKTDFHFALHGLCVLVMRAPS